MNITKEFRLILPNKPGELARICEALAKHEVNIRSIAGIAGTLPVMAITTEQEDGARDALKELGIDFQELELIIIKLTDVPGELAFFTRKLADANINIESIYMLGELAGEGKIGLTVTVNDIDKAKKLLAS